VTFSGIRDELALPLSSTGDVFSEGAGFENALPIEGCMFMADGAIVVVGTTFGVIGLDLDDGDTAVGLNVGG